MTRNELLGMYSQYPEALAEEVMQIFGTLDNEAERMMHNVAVAKVARLIRTEQGQKRLWRNVARVIVHTASNEGEASDGEEENR